MMTVANMTEKAVPAGQPDTETLAEKMIKVRAMLNKKKNGTRGPMTTFAETLLVLLEVTSQLAELDATSHQAMQAGENENDDTRKWREISASTMQFARSSLLDQQFRAIEVLQDLSDRGGSMMTEPEQVVTSDPMSKLVPQTPKLANSGLKKSPPPGFCGPPPGLSVPALPAPETPTQRPVAAIAAKPTLPAVRPPPGFEALKSTPQTTVPTYISRPKANSAPAADSSDLLESRSSSPKDSSPQGPAAAPWQSSRAKAAAAAGKAKQQAQPLEEQQAQGWLPKRPRASLCNIDEAWLALRPATVGVGHLLKEEEDPASQRSCSSPCGGVAVALDCDTYDYQ